VTKDVKKKPAIYNFSHEDGIAHQMSEKQRTGFIDALDKLHQKKIRAKKARGRKDSTA